MKATPFPAVVLALIVVVVLSGCGGGSVGPVRWTTQSAGTVDYANLTEDAANPLVIDPSFWEPTLSDKSHNPCVLYRNGQFEMWTRGFGDERVFHATSTDGTTWSGFTACTGLWARPRKPHVIWNGSQYEIWHAKFSYGYDMSAWDHAVSSDGVNWSGRAPCAAYAGHRPMYTGSPGVDSPGPCQVFFNASASATEPDYDNVWANKYVMYYAMLSGQAESIGLAVSPDGVTWGVATEGATVLAPAPGAWDSLSATFCTVLRDGAGYHMYYSGATAPDSGYQGIGYAHSDDGIGWTKHSSALLHVSDTNGAGEPIEWRQRVTYSPSAVVVDGQPLVFFNGAAVDPAYPSIGLARPAAAPVPDDTTPPVIVLNPPNPAQLWPPEEQTVDVALTGSVTETESGLQSVSLEIIDEYGQLSRTIDILASVDSSGALSVSVPLVAFRQGNDSGGRLYTLRVGATDNAGNAAEAVAVTVTVPHGNPNAGGNGNGNGWGRGKK